MQTPVGFIISWKVPTEVPLGALRLGIIAAGLNAVELAPDLRPASLVSRSATLIAKEASTKDAKRLARPLAHATRQITREDHDQTTGLSYAREAGLAFDDAKGKLISDDPILQAGLPNTQQRITETRTASDVTRVVQRIVEAAGADLIPVREQGGAYFIPQGSGIIRQVRLVLEAIGGSLSTFACTIGHGSDESVATVITDYLLKQIDELKASVDALGEKGIRSDVKSRRLTRVAELRERLGAYSTLIATHSTRLTSALDTAEEMILAKLGPDREEVVVEQQPEAVAA